MRWLMEEFMAKILATGIQKSTESVHTLMAFREGTYRFSAKFDQLFYHFDDGDVRLNARVSLCVRRVGRPWWRTFRASESSMCVWKKSGRTGSYEQALLAQVINAGLPVDTEQLQKLWQDAEVFLARNFNEVADAITPCPKQAKIA